MTQSHERWKLSNLQGYLSLSQDEEAYNMHVENKEIKKKTAHTFWGKLTNPNLQLTTLLFW